MTIQQVTVGTIWTDLTGEDTYQGEIEVQNRGIYTVEVVRSPAMPSADALGKQLLPGQTLTSKGGELYPVVGAAGLRYWARAAAPTDVVVGW